MEEEEEELQMQPIEGEEEELQMQSRGEGLNNMSMIRYSQSIPPPEEEELAQAKFVGKSASKFSSNVQSQAYSFIPESESASSLKIRFSERS